MMGVSSRRLPLALIFLTLLLLIGCFSVKVGGLGADQAALLAFAASFPPAGATSLALSLLWNTSSPVCSWPGIACSPTTPRSIVSLSLPPSVLDSAALLRRTPAQHPPVIGGGNGNADASGAANILSSLSPLSSLRSLSLPALNLSGPFPLESLVSFPLLSVLNLSSNNLSSSIPASLCSHFPFLSELHLESNQLTGSIPSELAQCTSLTSLTLHDNQLSGPIPASLGQLTLLQVFRAGGNALLSGALPAEFGNCSHLSELGIAATGISGRIPPEFGRLSNLATLMIFDAYLSGPIPPELGNCTQLVELHLFANALTGTIPAELGRLTKLEKLFLWQNELRGPIPTELGALASIQVLDLSQNEISGAIPESLGMLSTVSKLYLSANMLSGGIPAELGNCSMLIELQLDRNFLTGYIPMEMGKLSELEQLFLWNNSLEGEIPSSLGNCKQLQYLDLSWNRLSGSLPPQLFKLQSLYKFLLIANELTGTIPREIAQCRALYRLRLSMNRLSGPVPEELGELHNLTFLDISNNQITGPLPVSLAKCSALQLLNAHNNLLNGSIPMQLSDLDNLQSIDVSFNHFSGPLPPTLGSLSQLTKLNVGSNSLSGLIPPELSSCKKLASLDLSSNFFFGPIPSSLGQISTLSVSLNLSCNTLFGSIPTEFEQLFALGDLDVSHNKLSGGLDVLSKMGSLVSLNISYNLFTGTLPDAYIFKSMPVSNYLAGNPGLCLQTCPKTTGRGSKQKGRAILGFLFGSVGLMFAVGLILICTTRRHSAARVHEPDNMEWPWELTPFQKLSFTMDDILERMVESNIIGKGVSGEVYKVEVPSGEAIAVKKTRAVKARRAPAAAGAGGNRRDYFSTEVEALRAVRHNNIVRLMGVCTNHQVNLLLYDYMANGSLGEFLHEKGRALDWESRYRIALGAAQGLAYLHHDCVPPILHRDIKANNILLGAHLEPYLADFGLAKFVLTSNSHPQTVLAGSYGYIAPEYAYTLSITEKSDVYSYGVVLLEILTGKRPVEGGGSGAAEAEGGGAGRHVIDWVHEMRHCHHDVVEILDPRLRGMPDPFIKEMLHALGIAMECVHPLPAERPSMRHVVSLLVGIRHDIEEYAKLDLLAAPKCKASRRTKDMITSPKLSFTNTSSMCSFTPPSASA